MFTQKVFRVIILTLFAVSTMWIVSSCTSDKVAPSAEEVSPKVNLEDYPEEITMENWKSFVRAPQEVIDFHLKKEYEQFQPSEEAESLDPNKTAMFTLGFVEAFNGTWQPFGNVSITTNNCGTTSVNGNFGGANYFLSGGCTGGICMNFNTPATNGVSTFDLVIISRHILGITPFTEFRQFLAADADRDGDVDNDDIDEIRDVILFITTSFPNSENIVYIETGDYNTIDANLALVDPLTLFTLGTFGPCQINPDRRAVKTGDVSGNFVF